MNNYPGDLLRLFVINNCWCSCRLHGKVTLCSCRWFSISFHRIYDALYVTILLSLVLFTDLSGEILSWFLRRQWLCSIGFKPIWWVVLWNMVLCLETSINSENLNYSLTMMSKKHHHYSTAHCQVHEALLSLIYLSKMWLSQYTPTT